MDDKLVGHTKHGNLTLDQLAELQPGMSELMIAMANRYHVMFYAAMDGNYDLARFQLRGIRKILRHATMTRPKYAEALERFSSEYLDAIEKAMVARAPERVEATIKASILAGDVFHKEWGYPYIRYRIPSTRPAGYLTDDCV